MIDTQFDFAIGIPPYNGGTRQYTTKAANKTGLIIEIILAVLPTMTLLIVDSILLNTFVKTSKAILLPIKY